MRRRPRLDGFPDGLAVASCERRCFYAQAPRPLGIVLAHTTVFVGLAAATMLGLRPVADDVRSFATTLPDAVERIDAWLAHAYYHGQRRRLSDRVDRGDSFILRYSMKSAEIVRGEHLEIKAEIALWLKVGDDVG